MYGQSSNSAAARVSKLSGETGAPTQTCDEPKLFLSGYNADRQATVLPGTQQLHNAKW